MPLASSTSAARANAAALTAGLEIGHDQARLVVIARAGPRWRLEQCHQWPLQPEWLHEGRIADFLSLADALQQQLADTGVRKLAMALPPEACLTALLEAPAGLSRRSQRAWLQEQALALFQGAQSDICWSAHALPGRPPRWRLVCASLDLVQDWLGLAEAAQCELVRLDEVHQASWQALARWYRDAAESTLLLQVGQASVQALRWQEGNWQWAWRKQADGPLLLEHCLQTVSGPSPLALIGDGPLARTLGEQLQTQGLSLIRPMPGQCSSWDSAGPLDRLSEAFWPALGLACPPESA